MTKKRAKKNILELVLSVSRQASESLDIKTVADVILNKTKEFLKTDHAALFLLDDETERLILVDTTRMHKDQIANLKVLGGWEEINTELVKNRKAVIVNDVSRHVVFKGMNLPFISEHMPIGAFMAVPMMKDDKVIGVLIASLARGRKGRFSDADKKLLMTMANYVSTALLNAKLYEEMKMLFVNTIKCLTTAIDARDTYTHGHSRRVAEYSIAIAEEMKTSLKFLEDLKLAGLFHDVGKIGVKDDILNKDRRLTDEEFAQIQKHPIIGASIVSSIMRSSDVIRGIEEHHERFDGKGYPNGLKGTDIALSARIIALADTYDTITTDRPYHRQMTVKEALFEIAKCSGTHFDPKVVIAFQKSFSKFPDFWHFK